MQSLRSCVLLGALVWLSCGGGTPQPAPPSGRWSAPAILANVPADSPYLFASLENVSDKLRARLMAGMDHQVAEALRVLEGQRSATRTLDPLVRVLLALVKEMRDKPLSGWWKELGFDPNGHFVLYGLSVWPVMRAELADAARLRGVIVRVLSAAGVKPQQGSLGGREYWIAGNADVSFVAAVLEHEAVAAVLPTGALQSALPLVLGQQKPARHLGATETVPELLGRHHLRGYAVGYIDARNVISIVTSQQASELDAPLHAATGPIAPACRTDLQRLATIAPRLVIGYRQIDEAGFSGIALVETAPGVLGAVDKLHASVPELTTSLPERSLLAFGAAIDVGALVAWLSGVTGQLHDRPFTCPWLTPINEAGAALAEKLATPLPPVVRSARGFSVDIEDATIEPVSVDGHMILAGANIADKLSSLAGGIPWLTGIAPKADGRPVAIPTQALGLPISSIHVAMKGDRVVIASGTGSEQRATAHLATIAPSDSPMMMLAVDMPRVKKLLATLRDQNRAALASLDGFGQVGVTFDIAGEGVGFQFWGSWSDAALH